MQRGGKPNMRLIILPFGIAILAFLIWHSQPRSVQSESETMPTALLRGTAPTLAYYVSPAGTDVGSGSATAPWATIQHAADNAKPGTIIHVAPGTYIERIKTTISGTSAARITF